MSHLARKGAKGAAFGQPCFNFRQLISLLRRKSHQWNPCRLQRLIDKCIPLPTILALMGAVIQFYRCNQGEAVGLADDEIEMLEVDLVPGRLAQAFAESFDRLYHVAETDLAEDDEGVAQRLLQHTVKGAFGRREEFAATFEGWFRSW